MEKNTKYYTRARTSKIYNNYHYYQQPRNYEDYVFEKALGSIKENSTSYRNPKRRVPISWLEKGDEDKIPKKPETLLPQPDQKAYEEGRKKKLKRLDEIRETITKLNEERKGITSEVNQIYQELNSLLAQGKALADEKKEQDNLEYQDLREELFDLNMEVKKFERFKFPPNIKRIKQEIVEIKEVLSFCKLSVKEEKKLIEKKLFLEEFLEAKKNLVKFKEENKETFEKFGKKGLERKELNEKINEVKEKLTKAKEKRRNVDEPKKAKIKEEIDNLKNEREKIKNELYEDKIAFNKAWDDYEEQKKLIDYIDRANKRIMELKEYEEKQKKKEEKEKKRKKKADKKIEDKVTSDLRFEIIQYNDKAQMIKELDFLHSFFSNFIPIENQLELESIENEEEIQKKEKPKIDQNLNKGIIKELKKDEKKYGIELGTSEPFKKKKKGKAPKVREYTSEFVIDFDIINKLSSLGLVAPGKEEDIPKLLEEIKNKKDELIIENVEDKKDEKEKEKEEEEEEEEGDSLPEIEEKD